jgi:hypothetical protein
MIDTIAAAALADLFGVTFRTVTDLKDIDEACL